MFLHLSHTNLDVYKQSYNLTLEAYKITRDLPDTEKYNLIGQIRRAALSVRLNIAEGSSRKSEIERKRFYEIARGSVIEIDAALDVVVGLGYVKPTILQYMGTLVVTTFSELSGLLDKKNSSHY